MRKTRVYVISLSLFVFCMVTVMTGCQPKEKEVVLKKNALYFKAGENPGSNVFGIKTYLGKLMITGPGTITCTMFIVADGESNEFIKMEADIEQETEGDLIIGEMIDLDDIYRYDMNLNLSPQPSSLMSQRRESPIEILNAAYNPGISTQNSSVSYTSIAPKRSRVIYTKTFRLPGQTMGKTTLPSHFDRLDVEQFNGKIGVFVCISFSPKLAK